MPKTKKAISELKYDKLINRINQVYVENIYKAFLKDPSSVDSIWKSIFNNYFNHSTDMVNCKIQPFNFKDENNNTHIKKEILFNFIDEYRANGHKIANTNPINFSLRKDVPQLEPIFYNINKSDYNKVYNIHNYIKNIDKITFASLYEKIKTIYAKYIGYEYMHIDSTMEKIWIQKEIECNSFSLSTKEKKKILYNLIKSEGLEKYINSKFPGSKRFSLEGAESLIPMLSEIINYSKKFNISDIILGMAHRGRLNVLTNIFKKKARFLFSEFLNNTQNDIYNGDVKYHMGFRSTIEIKQKVLNLILKYNPSHLEIVNPIVMGTARSIIENKNNGNNAKILPINIHGDASIIGQGIIQETLNISQTRGHTVGGTIHIVINNQIGFTTSKKSDLRSSDYCTDIAKMINAPIFHVNSDNLESVIFIIRLALDFRYKFRKDVFIDLVCYRRHGHNEMDDPYVTQPILYQKIKNHPTVKVLYQYELEKKNIIDKEFSNILLSDYFKKLDYEYLLAKNKTYLDQKNAVDRIFKLNKKKILLLNDLKQLALDLNNIPKNINMHYRVNKIYADRIKMATGEKLCDWGFSETLAYATLLDNGISCRICGEDSRRGTFFHRHAVIHDQKTDQTYIPLTKLNNSNAKFNIWNSVLSEEAILAFEYGYSSELSNTLTIWEAQFGDFSNGAQIVIDQFISSGEQKWKEKSNLVMFLPHGYEGQGPEHSSARIERYLQLCSQNNMQVCIPTTSGQIYHLLRRQMLKNIMVPLIVITPKSLLRNHKTFTSLETLVSGKFKEIIHTVDFSKINKVTRLIFCTGKIYFDLMYELDKNKNSNISIIRIEQLYPFPMDILVKIINKFNFVKNFIWCQEEPYNQGAWQYIKDNLSPILPKKHSLSYIGRKTSASTAVGNFLIHIEQQNKIIKTALNVDNV